MNNFKTIGIPVDLTSALEAQNITIPTPIQEITIPVALTGKDILGSAQTGTGKTLAFCLPLIIQLEKNPKTTAMILTPTRELAQQVSQTIKHLLIQTKSPLRFALLIGGEPIYRQIRFLKTKPRIIVGTPGRILDHLDRKNLYADHTKFLVLDETDRMLDMGFGIQLDEILKYLPKQRQTLMFSATIPGPIARLANQYLTDPEQLSAGPTTTPTESITQEIAHLSKPQKYPFLLDQLQKREGSVIIFVKTKIDADEMAQKLYNEGFDACAIHGDLKQQIRQRVLSDFRKGKFRILVATDVAARGLDVPHVQHVINYDLPPTPEEYIHRIGRTGRAGAEGFAISFITAQESRKWAAIERLLDPHKKMDREREQRPKSNKPFFNKNKKRVSHRKY